MLKSSGAIIIVAAMAAGVTHAAVDVSIEAPASLSGVAERIRAMRPDVVARALSQAGLELPDAVRIVLVDRDDPASQNSAPWIVGQAFGNDTIVIYPQRIGTYPYDSLDAVVIHELAHLALSARAEGRPLPRWFHEGVAMSVESGWGLGSQMRLLLAAQNDPAIDEVSRLFASEALPATTTAYLLSAALVDDLRSRHGPTVPGTIAARVGAGADFEAAFFDVTGETPDQAAAVAWRVYRGLRWLPVITSPSSVWLLILAVACLAFVARTRRRSLKRQQWDEEERAEQAEVELPDRGDMS
jgi:hypothetical protein